MYPDEDQIAQLTSDLKDAKEAWSPYCISNNTYEQASQAIETIAELSSSNPYIIRDWVWIASQLRIAHPHDLQTSSTAWAGINVLLKCISISNNSEDAYLSSLNWLTDRVVEELIETTGPQMINRYVTHEEREQIDDLLLVLAEKNEPKLSTLIENASYIAQLFSSIHHQAYFPSAAEKLLNLAQVSKEMSEAGYWARAALRYVHIEKDVIDDSQGYMGYLDDIQVIEDVHDIIYGSLAWRPIVDYASDKWPMLSRIYWKDGNAINYLPPFLKSTAACALAAALDEKCERVIVAPEIGPLGFVSAALCALVDLKTESRTKPPLPGTIVIFRHGHLTRFARIAKSYDAGDGIMLPMVTLRDATISIPAQYAVLLEPATVNDPRLATTKQINEWMKTLEADQLTPVWRYRRVGTRPSVLYVTDRSRFFIMMDQIRPFGHRLDGLVPVAYHTRGFRTTIGTGAATVAPAMIVCNDLATAETTLKTAADEDRLPKYVMIDRTVDPGSLRSLAHRCRQLDPEIRVVTFAAPEAVRTIAPDEQEVSIWLIRPAEIDPIPVGTPSRAARTVGGGTLETFNRRQITATNVEFQTLPVNFDELDHFAALAGKIARRARHEQDREMETVAITSEAALRQISSHPPLGPRLLDERIEAVLENVMTLAGVHGLFDPEVAELGKAAGTLTEKLSSIHPKDRLLRSLLEEHPGASVLVGSRALAEEMNKGDQSQLEGGQRFVAPHDLEQAGKISVLVVPSWFGTKEMRRLLFGGWAPLQIRILFRYEITRLERLNGRLARELDSLTRRTRRSWQSFYKTNPDLGSPPPVPEQEKPTADTATVTGQASDATVRDEDTDWLETAIRNRIAANCRSGARRDVVTARLIFFDDGLHYGVFARDSSLICLNEVLGSGSDLSEIGEREAEKLLWKKVNSLAPGDILAFPDDSAYGDVIDGLADALIGDGGETRQLSGLWRDAVKAVVEMCDWDLDHARKRFADVGVNREISTLTSWIYSTKTVAPDRYAETIPAILKCAAKKYLLERSDDILAATSAVYTARRKAGHVLVAQLSSATINSSSGTAYVDIDGTQVQYRLLTVATVDPAASYTTAILGLHTTEDRLPKAEA